MNLDVFGITRSVVARDHALLTPDSHVPAPLFGWENTAGVTLISPRMGAGFVQYLASLTDASCSTPARAGVERFVYVLSGDIQVGTTRLETGGYAYLPPECDRMVSCAQQANLLVLERMYVPRAGTLPPSPVLGQEQNIDGLPFQNDPHALLKTLLPANDVAFDMAVNIFTYQPGATLPNVEVHVMEHGLMMIAGAGVYRLSDAYYPVREGDVIWMAPYCPQWFVAMGKAPARYLYYKDMHRDPLETSL